MYSTPLSKLCLLIKCTSLKNAKRLLKKSNQDHRDRYSFISMQYSNLHTQKIISNENFAHALFLLVFFPTYIFFLQRHIRNIHVHKRDPRKLYSISYCRSLMLTLRSTSDTPTTWGEATQKLFLFCVII